MAVLQQLACISWLVVGGRYLALCSLADTKAGGEVVRRRCQEEVYVSGKLQGLLLDLH